MGKIIYKELNHLLPTTTNVETLLANATEKGLLKVVQELIICNTASASKWVSVFLDNDGTTADTTTALLYQMPIDANETMIFKFGFSQTTGLYLPYGAGTIRVQCETANTINFTIFGVETGGG